MVLDSVIFVSRNFNIMWIDVAVLEIIRSFRGSEFFELCSRDLTALIRALFALDIVN